VPSIACESSLAFVPTSIPIPVSSSSDDHCEDENPPLLAHLPPAESIEHEPARVPLLSIWVHSTREAVGDLVGDPLDQRRTRLQFQGTSSLLAQVSETHDPEAFEGHSLSVLCFGSFLMILSF
jgi:hypothetical protein